MQARTMRDLGAVVREARRQKGLTQAELAAAVGVSREWVVRLEKGYPRLEAQLVLDALAAVGVGLSVAVTEGGAEESAGDVFDDILGRLTERRSTWPSGD
ncbi:transcriptional regulator [Actinobacteria bacterium YIM 96077]|uniref:XRE family transcriptional regulator n=1 Tax=Phytoactinopolyspora halophila TaxID=1981511 RepID=A0A329QT45_9ACTN|nr:helix-turn-helix domain-containing protein [Phytoactinopolyspora halophila]AYY14956.1 transcriptional regulator [Actinobacteria bacterium YIM 96077]RAW15413.1 XRE family transcriptional regulator [Phytoactinopolyspora halophila]